MITYGRPPDKMKLYYGVVMFDFFHFLPGPYFASNQLARKYGMDRRPKKGVSPKNCTCCNITVLPRNHGPCRNISGKKKRGAAVAKGVVVFHCKSVKDAHGNVNLFKESQFKDLKKCFNF